ncbi:MAG: NAD-binding oxidoreductase, partial [Pseudomonadota bacterium]
MRLRSYKNRPFHLGPYPLERLKRGEAVDLSTAPPFAPLAMRREDRPASLVNAIADYQAVLDAIRDGLTKRERGRLPEDPEERARHLKSFAYYCDASQAGTCLTPAEALLPEPVVNPDVAPLAEDLATRQTKTLASGIDVIMADLKDSMARPRAGIAHHTHALVMLFEHPRDPDPAEPGAEWIADMQAERACLRGAEVGAVIANYIRLLGWEARAHNATATDVDLGRLALAAGLAEVVEGEGGTVLSNPYLGTRFGVTA